MKNLEDKEKKLFSSIDEIVELKQILKGKNVVLTEQGLEDIERRVNLIEQDIKDHKEDERQDKYIKENQSKVLNGILFYLAGFFGFCYMSHEFFPLFYPNFIKIFNPFLPSIVGKMSNSLTPAITCCFLVDCSINNLERKRYIKLINLPTKIIVTLALLILGVLLNPFNFVFFLIPIFAEKYYKKLYKVKDLISNT